MGKMCSLELDLSCQKMFLRCAVTVRIDQVNADEDNFVGDNQVIQVLTHGQKCLRVLGTFGVQGTLGDNWGTPWWTLAMHPEVSK